MNDELNELERARDELDALQDEIDSLGAVAASEIRAEYKKLRQWRESAGPYANMAARLLGGWDRVVNAKVQITVND